MTDTQTPPITPPPSSNPIVQILNNIVGKWHKPWIITWFIFGAISLGVGFFYYTDHSGFEIFKLFIALIGMLCVVALAYRRNLAGNGIGMLANVGEIIVQGRSGATGLMLAPFFYLSTHLFALNYWRKSQDRDGNMVPLKANPLIWLITVVFILIGLFLFPTINDTLQRFRFIDSDNSTAIRLLGLNLSWYHINIIAFVLGVSAQTVMILRYSFSWVLWIVVNFVWLTVNIANQNTIFAIQTLVYQINAVVGLYGWWLSTKTQRA